MPEEIPTRALLEDDLLVPQKKGSAVPKSGHYVQKVFFSPSTGIIQTQGKHKGKPKMGFYKRCDSDYPPLLAKLSVGFSQMYRLALGDRAAEERLVYNEAGEIAGTVSIAMSDFVPMQAVGDEAISDPVKERLANPSIELLIKRDVAAPLVATWRYKDDDAHPGNMGTMQTDDGDHLIGRIDFDMSMYDETSVIKGERLTCGTLTDNPHNSSKLLVQDLDSFPNIKGTRTYWPSRRPAHGWILKGYKAQTAFAQLGGNPQFEDQMHFALLKELLAYQHNVLRDRLHSLLGNAPLELDKLDFPDGTRSGRESSDTTKKETLVELMPQKLFYDDYDRERKVVDHLLLLAADNYDEFYRIAVKRHTGLGDYLIAHPEAYQKAIDWFEAENTKIKPLSKTASKAEKLAYQKPFDIKKMEQQYQRIWQDSSAQTIVTLLFELKGVCDRVSQHHLNQSKKHVWQEMAEKSLLVHDNAPNIIDLKPEKNASLQKLESFSEEIFLLYTLLNEQTRLLEDDEDPTRQKHLSIMMACREKLAEVKNMFDALDNVSALKTDVTDCFETWDIILNRIDYNQHLKERKKALETASIPYRYERHDIAPGAVSDTPMIMTVDCPATAKRLIVALFAWLETEERGNIIQQGWLALKDYDSRPAGWLFSGRHEEIKAHLNTKRYSSHEMLQHIFNEGGWDATSYNTFLLKRLLTHMVDTATGQFGLDNPIVPAIQEEMKKKTTALDKHIGLLSQLIDDKLKAKIDALAEIDEPRKYARA
jgi:hypothetical protein